MKILVVDDSPTIRAALRALLERMGHTVVPSTDRYVFGTGQAIWRDPETGAFWGGTDPRADGAVAPLI